MMFNKIKYSEEQTVRINELGNEGVVAYVHRSKSILLHWILKKTIEHFKLPTLSFSAFKSASKVSLLLRAIKLGGGAIEFFLRLPHTAWSSQKGARQDYIRTLIRFQKTLEQPIFLVPHILVVGARSPTLKSSAMDKIFGSRGEPGFIRLLLRLMLVRGACRWVTAEPLNLKVFCELYPNAKEDVLTRKVRGILLKRIKVLERTYYGPPAKGHKRLKQDALRDNDLQNFMANIEAQTGLPSSKLQKKAQQMFSEMVAHFDIDVIHTMDKFLSLIWNRIYDGIVWKPSDIAKIKEASQRGPVILVPAHRSHMDYVVLSQILYWEGLMLPHIAAGDNMAFFPFGTIFRRGGAYFIRRSFKGDPLYAQVVKAYIKRLLREGYTQEFFIEGGRSRSGKTLPPKLGLLSIMADCLSKPNLSEATFIPVSISYEKLVEAGAIRRELEGAEKEKESARGLLSSMKLLRKRYGRVFVNFDEPISFSKFYETHEGDHKHLVKLLAHQIISGINRCTVITPVSLIATALLASKRRILSKGQLEWSVRKIAKYIYIPKPNLESHLAELVEEGTLVAEQAGRRTYYRVLEKNALSLDYYKNNLLHHFVADAIMATAFRVSCGSSRRKSAKRSVVEKKAKNLSQIFKFEFNYPPGQKFEEIFEKNLNRAVEARLVARVQDRVCLIDSRESDEQLFFAANLLSNFIDAYWVCAKKLESAVRKKSTKKALISHLLEALREAALSGSSDYPEIVSKSLVGNALLLFQDMGVLEFSRGKAKLNPMRKDELKRIRQILQECHYERV
ncbi:MAG: 1-acyl-sn-glycerol-3-phosphate acyltransferase [Deltaproteobacteria bacterium]|nr:1-acyl-sn-glycerol-3-phosphate acyltransferase [Deltaproteobacteria bacterium]